MKKLNHSRYIDVYAKDIGDSAYWKAKSTPTAKQIKFYKKLYAMCKENDVDTNTGEYAKTRVEYAWAIDKLIKRLQEKGIDVKGNGKDVTYVLKHGSDRRGRYHTTQHIVINDKEVGDGDMKQGTVYLSQTRTPVPQKSVEESDKPGKAILSVDFETGEISGDYHKKLKGEDNMPEAIHVLKEDFLNAIKQNKSVRETAKALGISIGSFYKFKELYAEDIAEMDKSAPDMDVRLDPVDADYQNEDPTDLAVVGQKISIELNPEPLNKNKVTALEALQLLEDMREESDSVSAIFECMKNQPWHPNIRSILLSHKLGVDRQIKRIEEVLESITVAI